MAIGVDGGGEKGLGVWVPIIKVIVVMICSKTINDQKSENFLS